MTERILVVAAHPDDEALGCGGTIARHGAEGDSVTVAFLTDGVGARNEATGGSTDSHARCAAAAKAADVLGVEPPVFLNFPDNRLDTVTLLDIVQAIEGVVRKIRPSRIYTHHSGDLNVDHRLCHQAVITATRPMPGRSVRAIYGFEVPSSTEWMFGSRCPFQPNRFVDVSAFVTAKLAALQCYEDEMRPFPHPRSARAVEALAVWRGATAGLDAAEAFTVIRQVV